MEDANKYPENENKSDGDQGNNGESDKDDNKDESHDDNTFDIESEQRPIVKEDFIGKLYVASHLFEVDQDDKVSDFFAHIFGLHDIFHILDIR